MVYVPPVRVIGPKGPEDSQFVIVGEAPGVQEIKAGIPFVGPSGSVLDYALSQIPKESYPEPYITTAFKSLITVEKSPKFISELAMKVRPALLEEIGKHPRRVIIACGSLALQALLGDTSLKITKARGRIYPSELASVGIVASVHPAFLLRGSGSLRQFLSDILQGIHIAQGHEPKEWVPPSWSVVRSEEELLEHINYLKEHPQLVAGDIETSGFSFFRNQILSMGYTWDGNHIHLVNGYKTDAGNPDFTFSNDGKVFRGGFPNLIPKFGPMFDIPGVKWGWHNGKFDCKFFRHLGMNARVDEDSMLQSYSLDEQRGIHDLETVSADWLNSPNWKGVLDQYLPNKKTSYDAIPWPILFRYQAYDIANTYRLIMLMHELQEADPIAHKQYYRSLIPASEYLMRIELKGLLVDQARVTENLKYYEDMDKPLIAKIHEIAEEAVPGGHAAKIWTDKVHNSPTQLADLIFDRLKVPYKDPRAPKIRGTDDGILEKLRPDPIIVTLRQHRKVAKGSGTYVKPYTEDPVDGCIEPDGRIHTTYLIHGSATGRLASRDPNLQNIPRDPKIRGQLIAPPGRMFIEPDLNQAELRSLAILSGDPELCRIYNEATISLHEKVRGEIFGQPEDWSPQEINRYLDKFFLTPETRYDAVTKEDRIVAEQKMKAKNVNFGIIYGITEAGLAEQTGEQPYECKHWLEVWAQTFPVAWNFIKSCRLAPLHNQNLVTVFGYRKRFKVVSPENLISTQNESANMPHQSTASVITMHGGIRTYERLEAMDAYYVNTVHDSLLIEAPEDPDIAYQITKMVCNELTQVPRDWGLTAIPFVADAKWGNRWGSLGSPKKYAASKGWDYAALEAKYA